MLPLEAFLLLLKELDEQTVARSKAPSNRDAYELGYIGGLFAASAWMDDKIRQLIQQNRDNEDDE